jgi:hypothetical protein
LYKENPFLWVIDKKVISNDNKPLSARYYQYGCKFLTTWIITDSRWSQFWILCHYDSTQKSISYPIYVEAIPYDSPFIFNNTFGCIADRPLWETALACGRQLCKACLKDAAYEQFLVQSGLPLRSALLPISADLKPDAKALILAKQMFHSRLIKDLYDDIKTLAKLYVKLLVLLLDPYSVAEDWPGMSQAKFAAFKERLDGQNELLFDSKVFKYVFDYFFDSKIFGPKTRDLWRQYRFVFKTLVGQVLSEIGNSLLCGDGCALHFNEDRIIKATPKRIARFLNGEETSVLLENDFENAEAERQAWADVAARTEA